MTRILGTSKQNIRQRAARGTLLHIADELGVRYPLWQLVDGRVPAAIGLVTSDAHRRGINDTALVRRLEADADRIVRCPAGNLLELVELLPSPSVRVTRHRVAGPATENTDEHPTSRRVPSF